MSGRVSRFLFIGPDHGSAVGGREQLSQLHQHALRDLLGKLLDTLLLPRLSLSGRTALNAVFSGRIDGTDRAAERKILAHIAARDIGHVWLDGSNLGAIARAVRRQFPKVRVTTFFHNVEARFFVGALRARPGLRAVGILAANFAAERMAVHASTQCVALNRRDSDLMRRLYGRGADHLLPMAIPADAIDETAPAPISGDYLLFVGGGFYANQAGILWYARHVASALSMPTLIVGRGLEALGPALGDAANIRLVGEVDALGPYYRHAKAVVAPIFDGSGMKTKVAEALMHGKHVIGTREAFTGYDEFGVGQRCDTRAAFIAAIKSCVASPPAAFDPRLRALYEAHFSPQALRRGMEAILARRTETIGS